jgi:YspA, cpYpsA-related SLOG family
MEVLSLKTIIAGSRNITDLDLLEQFIEKSGLQITTVISGSARGIDKLGETWADKHDIPVLRYPAEWKKYGRGAGPVRNKDMVDNAEACIVLWDGRSKGTKNMIDLAHKKGLLIHIYKVPVDIDS